MDGRKRGGVELNVIGRRGDVQEEVYMLVACDSLEDSVVSVLRGDRACVRWFIDEVSKGANLLYELVLKL